jgi:hypothetical protein
MAGDDGTEWASDVSNSGGHQSAVQQGKGLTQQTRDESLAQLADNVRA